MIPLRLIEIKSTIYPDPHKNLSYKDRSQTTRLVGRGTIRMLVFLDCRTTGKKKEGSAILMWVI